MLNAFLGWNLGFQEESGTWGRCPPPVWPFLFHLQYNLCQPRQTLSFLRIARRHHWSWEIQPDKAPVTCKKDTRWIHKSSNNYFKPWHEFSPVQLWCCTDWYPVLAAGKYHRVHHLVADPNQLCLLQRWSVSLQTWLRSDWAPFRAPRAPTKQWEYEAPQYNRRHD